MTATADRLQAVATVSEADALPVVIIDSIGGEAA